MFPIRTNLSYAKYFLATKCGNVIILKYFLTKSNIIAYN